MEPALKFGIDEFLKQASSFEGYRTAIVCNKASQTADGIPSYKACLKSGIQIVTIFSPEHGFDASGEDGVYQHDSSDEEFHIPVISLYGNSLKPGSKSLQNIDLVLIDLQEIGCRFYTYLWTMTYVMEACMANKIQCIILDRPNPLSGNFELAEGPFLDELNCSSFIGRFSIPIRHSCTLGELALYFRDRRFPDLDLDIMKMQGWTRDQYNRIIHYPTSPAIRKFEIVLMYPGLGLLEGIQINEGRGTDTPFLKFGSPFLHGLEIIENLNRVQLNGLRLHPTEYIPEDGIYHHEVCRGVEIEIMNHRAIKPVQFGIQLIHTLIRLYPHKIIPRLYPTLANPTGENHLDRLLGVQDSFKHLSTDIQMVHEISDQWQTTVHPYLLYGS